MLSATPGEYGLWGECSPCPSPLPARSPTTQGRVDRAVQQDKHFIPSASNCIGRQRYELKQFHLQTVRRRGNRFPGQTWGGQPSPFAFFSGTAVSPVFGSAARLLAPRETLAAVTPLVAAKEHLCLVRGTPCRSAPGWHGRKIRGNHWESPSRPGILIPGYPGLMFLCPG